MTARWVPGDVELDAVARTLDADAPSADRVEHIRTAILASAATRKQKARYSAVPFVAAGIAIAAAATVVLVIGTHSGERTSTPANPVAATPRQLITPIGIARFERVADWPDYMVRIDDGKLAVQVGKLATGERFRVKTADADIEVRGTKFDVGVETGRLTSVAVHDGRVEVRRTDQQVVILSAGESWAPVQTARRDQADLRGRTPDLSPPGDQVPSADHTTTADHATTTATATQSVTAAPSVTADHAATGAHAATVDQATNANHRTTTTHATTADHVATSAITTDHATNADHASTADHTTTTAPVDASRPAPQPNRASNDQANHLENPPPAGSCTPQSGVQDAHGTAAISPLPAAPGEAEFRAGWAALRTGDPAAAATAFATACKTVHSDAIGEDACFWAGAAAKRAGDTATARAALSQFVQRFPTSSRAAEASALLGWLLYDAGELDVAEKLFQKAEHDPVPKVRDSATRGLTAIDRKRHGTR